MPNLADGHASHPRFSFRLHAPDGALYDAAAFDGQFGKPFLVDAGWGQLQGELVAAVVCDSGAFADLTVRLPESAGRIETIVGESMLHLSLG